MKKILTSLLAASLMLLGTQAFAQMYVNAGYLSSTQTFKESSTKPINSNGAFAGVSFNVPLFGGVGIAPGFYYSMITNKNGSSGTVFGFPVSASSTFMEHSINVPLYLNFGSELAYDTRVYVFGGPTAQYGLASTTKLAGGVGESSADKTYDNYESNSSYNRFNVYLGGGVGFTVAHINLTVGYDYGMMNLYKGDNATQTHRSNLKIGLGFVF